MILSLASVVIPHLLWAQRLVADLRPEHNSYGRNPSLVLWRGVDGAPISRNRSDCSSFITALWSRAYGYGSDQMRQWLGVAAPRARDYHEAIVKGNRFQRIERIVDLQSGDLLATRYQRSRSDATGHVMLAASRPTAVGVCSEVLGVFRLQAVAYTRLTLPTILRVGIRVFEACLVNKADESDQLPRVSLRSVRDVQYNTHDTLL